MAISTAELVERISSLLDTLFRTDERLHDCFTVEIQLQPRNKLCVFIDSDSGVNFNKCQIVSRYLESHLDTHGWMGEKYVLEVSSPGVGRPLRFWRQYRNNIGRHVQVTLLDNTSQRGILKAIDEHHIILEQTIVQKQGSRRVQTTVEKTIPFEQIASTVVKVVL
ncbi:MAG: ribosome maturation factor [Saprospiraceae bacterium]|nr:ribosome maturation factor [Saprospiraceae bacterium]MDW8482819.1 ribosome maturation factor [Saprospiraceae bacterium]